MARKKKETSVKKPPAWARPELKPLLKKERTLQAMEEKIMHEKRVLEEAVEAEKARQLPEVPDMTEEEIIAKYPHVADHMPPTRHPLFVSKWASFLPSLTQRPHFSDFHLEPLALLCDAYMLAEQAKTFLQKNGLKYRVVNRLGDVTYKPYPEVKMLSNTRNEIVRLTNMLGLRLAALKKPTALPGSEETQWD